MLSKPHDRERGEGYKVGVLIIEFEIFLAVKHTGQKANEAATCENEFKFSNIEGSCYCDKYE